MQNEFVKPGDRVYYNPWNDPSVRKWGTVIVPDRDYPDEDAVVARWEPDNYTGWMPPSRCFREDGSPCDQPLALWSGKGARHHRRQPAPEPKPVIEPKGIDWTKPVRNADSGNRATVLTVNGTEPGYPVVVQFPCGAIGKVSLSGKLMQSGNQMENCPPPPVSQKRWVYLHRRKSNGVVTVHFSACDDWCPNPMRHEIIAKKEVTITEGEGM